MWRLSKVAPATAATARGHGTRKDKFRMQPQRSEPRDGLVVASGYGLKIYVQRGHLVVEYGVGSTRQRLRLSRATSGVKRLVT